MDPKWGLFSFLSAFLIAISMALPSSLIDQIKSSEAKTIKVKRNQPEHADEEHIGKMTYFNDKPTSAIKRGANLKDTDLEEFNGPQFYRYNNEYPGFMENIQAGFYNSPSIMNEKLSIPEMEKSYRYALNNERKLEDAVALDNAALKDLYYHSYNPYRYYEEDRRRKRDITTSYKESRIKRNMDLTPEEILALLAYEKNMKTLKQLDDADVNYNEIYNNYEAEPAAASTYSKNSIFPASRTENDYYLYGDRKQNFRPRWGSFQPNSNSNKNKRFIVAKKRANNPKQLAQHYLNAANYPNDYNTLSNFMNNNNQKDPDFDNNNNQIYRRYGL